MARKPRCISLINLMAALPLICCLAGPVMADEDRVEALESRVAELEALVHQLLRNEGSQSTPAEMAAVGAAAGKAAAASARSVVEEQLEMEAEAAKRHGYHFGGYAKMDAIYSDFGGGPVPSGSAGRDFYMPATIPVGGEGESYLDFSAKETRFNFRTMHLLDDGAKLGAFIEVDFLMSSHGDERVSNSYNPRLRQAYLTYNRWLFGQTWMTLYNLAACPDNLDFIGPSESTIFGRQAMIRYTNGPWQAALENPETTITPYGGGERIVADDNNVPDAVLRYNHRADWGSFTAAGIARQLAYENRAAGIDDDTAAYGVSLSGRFNVGARDDLRWMASAGKGLGRYIGLNTANGAVLDEWNKLHAIESAGVFGSYRHYWAEKWRSSLTLGYLAVDNPVDLTGPEVTQRASSAHLNLIYSPQEKVDFGVEFIYADRELENGEDGDLTRLQFSAKYAY